MTIAPQSSIMLPVLLLALSVSEASDCYKAFLRGALEPHEATPVLSSMSSRIGGTVWLMSIVAVGFLEGFVPALILFGLSMMLVALVSGVIISFFGYVDDLRSPTPLKKSLWGAGTLATFPMCVWVVFAIWKVL